MATKTEMKVGKRDPDAEGSRWKRRMKELESDPDGKLKLKFEKDSMNLNKKLKRLLADMRELKMPTEREDAAELQRGMKEIESDPDGKLKLKLPDGKSKLELEKVSMKLNKELQRLRLGTSLLDIKQPREAKDAKKWEFGNFRGENLDCLRCVMWQNRLLSRRLNNLMDLKHELLDGSKDTTKRDSATGENSSKEKDLDGSKDTTKRVSEAGEKASKEGLKGERSRKSKAAKAAKKIEKRLAEFEEWERRKEEEERNRIRDPDELTDPLAYQAKMFEKTWNTIYLTSCGHFEDNTSIPCKRYTVNPAPRGGLKRATLQVFSVKVAELTGGLQWPLNVFGMVALRDSLDHNRNVIFKRERDNFQTLTDENPYLALTGPVRGVVFCGPVFFEVLLYVRGTTESDDKELSLLAVGVRKTDNCPMNSLLIMKSYTSRLSTVDFVLGHIVDSVEATISMKVISGPPNGFYGEFIASTDFLRHEVLLHNSGAEELHLAGDEINLSRSVISVESDGKLMITVRASDGSVTLMGTKEFEPLEKGTTSVELQIAGLCQLEITVAWSLFSSS